METTTTRCETTDGKGFSEVGTITFQGREFSARGAEFHPDADRCVGYLTADEDGEGYFIGTFSGERMGNAWIVARWPTPRSFLSNEMMQVEARIKGILFTGRTGGKGMLWRGKRKAKQD